MTGGNSAYVELYGGGSGAGGVVVDGTSSTSSKTTSYSVMKREKTGAGIFNVGENTIPTTNQT